jgi:hypothetical protein
MVKRSPHLNKVLILKLISISHRCPVMEVIVMGDADCGFNAKILNVILTSVINVNH